MSDDRPGFRFSGAAGGPAPAQFLAALQSITAALNSINVLLGQMAPAITGAEAAMTGDNAAAILALLEPQAHATSDLWSAREPGILAATQISIAISLQRIAAALGNA